MKIITENAVVINAEGYRQDSGVTVTDMGDIIAIGDTPHNKSDLEIRECEIESPTGWRVIWE